MTPNRRSHPTLTLVASAAVVLVVASGWVFFEIHYGTNPVVPEAFRCNPNTELTVAYDDSNRSQVALSGLSAQVADPNSEQGWSSTDPTQTGVRIDSVNLIHWNPTQLQMLSASTLAGSGATRYEYAPDNTAGSLNVSGKTPENSWSKKINIIGFNPAQAPGPAVQSLPGCAGKM